MALSIQQLLDDSKFSHTLRFEVLEQVCPPELVSDLLSRCHAWGERERSLNQLLVVYYVIALSLFRRLNLAAVLGHLVRGLRWLWSNPLLRLPTAGALVYRRRQLGTPVMRHLLQRVCRPMATEQTTGAFRFGLRLMAIDGTLDEVADTEANALYFGRRSLGKHQSPFPQVRCLYLAEVGTHAIVDAVFAPCRVAEPRLAPLLLSRAVQPGMLVMMDRGIVSAAELSALVHQRQAQARAASESQRLHPCRAGARRWQLSGHPASCRLPTGAGARDRVSSRATHRRATRRVSCFSDEQPPRSASVASPPDGPARAVNTAPSTPPPLLPSCCQARLFLVPSQATGAAGLYPQKAELPR